MIKGLINRYRFRKHFSHLVTKEGMEKIISGEAEKEASILKESFLEFVFVAVRGNDAQQISERMGTVADLGIEHGGIVDSIVSSLVIVVFGMFPNDSKGTRFSLVIALQEKFGSEIKIVHGSEKCHYGNLGGKTRFSYSFIIPNFLEVIQQLSSTNFGEVKEIRKAS